MKQKHIILLAISLFILTGCSNTENNKIKLPDNKISTESHSDNFNAIANNKVYYTEDTNSIEQAETTILFDGEEPNIEIEETDDEQNKPIEKLEASVSELDGYTDFQSSNESVDTANVDYSVQIVFEGYGEHINKLYECYVGIFNSHKNLDISRFTRVKGAQNTSDWVYTIYTFTDGNSTIYMAISSDGKIKYKADIISGGEEIILGESKYTLYKNNSTAERKNEFNDGVTSTINKSGDNSDRLFKCLDDICNKAVINKQYVVAKTKIEATKEGNLFTFYDEAYTIEIVISSKDEISYKVTKTV